MSVVYVTQTAQTFVSDAIVAIMNPPPRRRLVATGIAADQIGVHRATLVRWWQDGIVRPAEETAGGHARWDVDDLRRQIREWRKRERADAGE